MHRHATRSTAVHATRVARGFAHLAFSPPPSAPTRRVVVTGLGAVTPFGVGVQHSWEALLDSRSAIKVLFLGVTSLNGKSDGCLCVCVSRDSVFIHVCACRLLRDSIPKDWHAPSPDKCLVEMESMLSASRTLRTRRTCAVKTWISSPLLLLQVRNRGYRKAAAASQRSTRVYNLHSLLFQPGAAREAIEDSGWKPASDEERERAVCTLTQGL